jgi:hypothetical protein
MGDSLKRADWTRKEMVISLAYYATLSYPKVIDRLAGQECSLYLPGRSSSSVALRLANYVARDPQMAKLGFKGMYGGGQKVDQIWDEFSDRNGLLDWKKLVMALLEESTGNGK